MTIQDFFNQWNNKFCDYDHAFGPQCKDLFSQYNNDILGNPYIVGNPADMWNLNLPQFDKIKNTPLNYPKLGDVIIWGTQISPTGHIAICQSANLFNFVSFDQNWIKGSPCQFIKHSYKGVLGWFRPKPKPFVMQYTCVNADPNLMEQARQLMLKYTGNKIDASFVYETQTLNSLNVGPEQQSLVRNIQTPFVMAFYHSSDPTYFQMATAEVIGSTIILTAATDTAKNPLNYAYEFANALALHFKRFDLIQDVYQPDETFVQKRFQEIVDSGIV